MERRSRLNPKQDRFCQLFVALGVATEAYRQAGYKGNGRSLVAASSRLLANVDVQDRIARLTAVKDVRMTRKDITKEALIEKFWEIVHDPESKRGEATQAGIAICKMVGWNAPTRVEHDLGDRVRAYLEDIRNKPLRPMLQVVDVKRIAP